MGLQDALPTPASGVLDAEEDSENAEEQLSLPRLPATARHRERHIDPRRVPLAMTQGP